MTTSHDFARSKAASQPFGAMGLALGAPPKAEEDDEDMDFLSFNRGRSGGQPSARLMLPPPMPNPSGEEFKKTQPEASETDSVTGIGHAPRTGGVPAPAAEDNARGAAPEAEEVAAEPSSENVGAKDRGAKKGAGRGRGKKGSAEESKVVVKDRALLLAKRQAFTDEHIWKVKARPFVMAMETLEKQAQALMSCPDGEELASEIVQFVENCRNTYEIFKAMQDDGCDWLTASLKQPSADILRHVKASLLAEIFVHFAKLLLDSVEQELNSCAPLGTWKRPHKTCTALPTWRFMRHSNYL